MSVSRAFVLAAATAFWAMQAPAAGISAPVGPPPTCKAYQVPWIGTDSLRTPEQIHAAHQALQASAATNAAFEKCLQDGLAVLRGDWKVQGLEPDSVVETAVAQIIVDRRQRLGMMTNRVNVAAMQFDATLPQGDPAAIGLLPNVEFTIARADAAAASAPPGVPRLTLASQPLSSTMTCVSYYPKISLRLGESGKAVVGFDVGADGTLTNVHVIGSSGILRLDDAAVACVTAQWRHTPRIDAGVPVAATGFESIIEFNLF